MKFKMKKRHWFYLLLILFFVFLIWIFNRSVVADGCSVGLNACLMKSKAMAYPYWEGFVCVWKNLNCLMASLF
ncbi:MAG: hypothetical protein E7013_05945 [Alphaproteobacteria bacterium]|nr:hypothetical protein [Alphaproteobacteria bacterium]